MIPKKKVELRLDPKSQIVEFYSDGRWIYEINLNDFSDPAEALDWIRQISQKTWATNQTISDLCSFGLEALKHAR